MKLLFVEDDELIASGLLYTFSCEGYEVEYCRDFQTALETLKASLPDLALLDVTLPDGNGFELCRIIKGQGAIPVIFLTAAEDEGNTVRGLDMGADDYIAKPFRLQELIARIRAVLRRQSANQEPDHGRIVIEDIEIHTRQAKVYAEKAEIILTAAEYRLLLVLALNRGQTLTREQILSLLWDGKGNYVNDNTLTVNIKRLREKLSKHTRNPELIRTIRGIGYRME